MNIVLHCEPNTPPLKWEDFLAQAPRQSIAIDGYVIGRPMFDHQKLVVNANHHEGVDRFSTRCTAAQLALQIRTGLFEGFSTSEPLHVFFNDCDQDVCLSIFLLRNIPLARGIVNPILNRILMVEDMLDTTSGGYGYPPDLAGMEENNWLFAPYTMARQNGGLSRRDPIEFKQVTDAVGARILYAMTGRGDRLLLDVRYEVIRKYASWSMAREVGINARAGMFSDGIKAFVSVRPRQDGRVTYSIGRTGIWIPFDIPLILERLNEAENDPINKWGGGDTIGGSPRATGSRLTLDQVAEVIERTSGH